jgi:hypothetical protein
MPGIEETPGYCYTKQHTVRCASIMHRSDILMPVRGRITLGEIAMDRDHLQLVDPKITTAREQQAAQGTHLTVI